jgi:N-acetylglucosamine kinase-like BadF-type ATPase
LVASTAELVLGVDAGGTKTHALVVDRDGRVVGFGSAGPGNWEVVGLDGMLAALGDAIDAALAVSGGRRRKVAAAAFGLAGLDWPSDVPVLGAAIARLGIGGTRYLANDAFVALRAGCREPFGLVSNAGTGTVTAGRNHDGDTFRTMAIGFGEHGGGGELVRDGLDAVAAWHHGHGPPTALTGRLLAATGTTTVAALFEGISRGSLDLGASASRLVVDAAADGDPVAVGLADRMGRDLAASVAGVALRLGMASAAFELVTTGGIHAAGCAALDDAFRAGVAAACPGARPAPLTAPPAAGAALLALERLGPVDGDLHDRLVGSAIEARVA